MCIYRELPSIYFVIIFLFSYIEIINNLHTKDATMHMTSYIETVIPS